MFDDLRPHLVELRKRLGLSVASVFIVFFIAFFFSQQILTWITKPLDDALTQVGISIQEKNQQTWHTDHPDTNTTQPSTTSQIANNLTISLQNATTVANKANQETLARHLQEATQAAQLLAEAIKNTPQEHFRGEVTTNQVAGTLFVAIKVSFFAALLGALPFVLYQLWMFVAPGLYDNEKKMVIPFVVGGSLMFYIGVLFAYYIVTPFGFQFLITFGAFLYTPLINIEDYLGFFTKILMGFGIAFELPVFAYFLALLGLVTDRTLIDFFRYAVVIIFVLAAILTPPDVITQFLMALPLVLLYGVSILIVRIVNPEPKTSSIDKTSE